MSNTETPSYMSITQVIPYFTEHLAGTTLAAKLDDDADKTRVSKIIYRYIASGVLPALHLGRKVYLSRAQLDDWIANGGSAFEGGWRKAAKTDARDGAH